MTQYVCGFLFNSTRSMVLLLTKRRGIPGLEWMGGKLNGIGGKINASETPETTMHREFLEETGLEVSKWQKFLTLHINGNVVHFYRAFSKEVPTTDHFNQDVAEPIALYRTHLLNRREMVSNLRWIIPMAQDPDIINSITYTV